jgi:hypothetical protein
MNGRKESTWFKRWPLGAVYVRRYASIALLVTSFLGLLGASEAEAAKGAKVREGIEAIAKLVDESASGIFSGARSALKKEYDQCVVAEAKASERDRDETLRQCAAEVCTPESHEWAYPTKPSPNALRDCLDDLHGDKKQPVLPLVGLFGVMAAVVLVAAARFIRRSTRI